MKKTLLTFILSAILFSVAWAQSGNAASNNNTSYTFNFNGSASDNCSTNNGVPRFDYLAVEYPSYNNYSFNGSELVINKQTQIKNYSQFPMSFHNDNCQVEAMDFSGGIEIEISVDASVATPQCQIVLGDQNIKMADKSPKLTSLVPGVNRVVLSGTNEWQDYQGNPVDATKITLASLYFRNSWNDKDSGNQLTGTFKIDWIAFNSAVVTSVDNGMFENDLKVYPNPASSNLNIEFDSNSATNISILDMTGKSVYSSSNLIGVQKINIDTDQFSTGLYFVRFENDNGIFTKKVTIQ